MAHVKKQRFGLYKNPNYSSTYYNLVLGDVTIVYRFNEDNTFMHHGYFVTEVLGGHAFHVRLL